MKEKLSSKLPQLRVEESIRESMDQMTIKLDRRDLTDFHRLLLRKACQAYRNDPQPPGKIVINIEFTMPGR